MDVRVKHSVRDYHCLSIWMVANMQIISVCATTIQLRLMRLAKSIFPFFTSSCACWSTKTTPCNGVTDLDWKQKAWHWTPLNTYNCSAFAPRQWCKGVNECTVCQICQDIAISSSPFGRDQHFPPVHISTNFRKKNPKTTKLHRLHELLANQNQIF